MKDLTHHRRLQAILNTLLPGISFLLFIFSIKCLVYSVDRHFYELFVFSLQGNDYPRDLYHQLILNIGVRQLKAIGYEFGAVLVFGCVVAALFRYTRNWKYATLLLAVALIICRFRVFDFNWSAIACLVSLKNVNGNISMFFLSNGVIYLALCITLLFYVSTRFKGLEKSATA